MKLNKFFKKLDSFYKGVEIGNKRFAVKFYLENNSFSYDIHQSEEEGYFDFNFLKKPLFQSEVFYYWKDCKKEILKDIKTNLNNLK